jgi:DNA-binding MarR family transcriptional regulator
MSGGDRIDELAAQWSEERPELDAETMAVVGRLLVVADLINRRLEGSAGEHGLDRAMGDILFTLRRAGSPYRLSPSRLSASLLVTSGTMTNRLDRLEARGLIERLANPDDRRGTDVQLTGAGLELVDGLVSEHVANEQEMLEPLSAREREGLVRAMRKLLAHLEP